MVPTATDVRSVSSAPGSPRAKAYTLFDGTDWFVCAALLLFGALQFSFYLKAPDLVNDATYFELAKSILTSGSYQFDFRPETLLPPGFPFILAVIMAIAGSGPGVLYHVTGICTTLGLFVSYALLRQAESRTVAATTCLLLGSAPALFVFSTRLVFSDMPYFFTSTLTLLLIFHADRSTSPAGRKLWAFASAIALTATILIRSAGIAILLALCAWVLFSFLTSKRLALQRSKLILAPLLAGLLAQAVWTAWETKRQFAEWPIPGYPASYLSQLELKTGNDPELGKAHIGDIRERIGQNIVDRSTELVKLLTRIKWINPQWPSVCVSGLFILMSLGLFASIRETGGQLHDWYFAINELLYLLWPWNFELRFLLPTVPLACLYLWRGAKVLKGLVTCGGRTFGVCLLLTGTWLGVESAVWFTSQHSLQALASALGWAIVALTGAALIPGGQPYLTKIRLLLNLTAGQARTVRMLLRTTGVVYLALTVLLGLALQIGFARRNAHFQLARSTYYPDIEAAEWISLHEPAGVVVMARKEDLVYHFSHHRVVWFPPVSDPRLLLDGIRKYHVGAIIVVDRDGNSYWQPPDNTCFRALQRAYGGMFRLIHSGPQNQIFAVNPEGTAD